MDDLFRWLRAEWDRVAGFGLVGLGALLLVLGYAGVSRSPYVAQQLAYIVSGGLGGMFCLGFGSVMLVGADLHDDWRKLDRIEAAIREAAAVNHDSTAGQASDQADATQSVDITAGLVEQHSGQNGNGSRGVAPRSARRASARPGS